MFVQLKTGYSIDQGPCWISRFRFSKSWQTAYFHGLGLPASKESRAVSWTRDRSNQGHLIGEIRQLPLFLDDGLRDSRLASGHDAVTMFPRQRS